MTNPAGDTARSSQVMLLALELWNDLELLRQFLFSSDSEIAERASREKSSLLIIFDEMTTIAAEDYDSISHHGWQVAGEDAYPRVVRVNPGITTRVPFPTELELLETCLRGIPEFVRQSCGEEYEMTVPTTLREIPARFTRIK